LTLQAFLWKRKNQLTESRKGYGSKLKNQGYSRIRGKRK